MTIVSNLKEADQRKVGCFFFGKVSRDNCLQFEKNRIRERMAVFFGKVSRDNFLQFEEKKSD